MRRTLKIVAAGLLAIVPGWASAKDAALLVINETYAAYPAASPAPNVTWLLRDLDAAGFVVTSLIDAGPLQIQAAVEGFRDDAAGADRVLIMVAGHLVQGTRDSWLLHRNAGEVTDLSVGQAGLPLGPLFDMAAEHPGQAVVMLAPSTAEITGPGIAPGASVVAPQGVTLMSGPGQRLVRAVRETLMRPGTAPRQALTPPPPGIEVSGFLSDALPFLPAPTSALPEAPEPPGEVDMELAFWNVVVGLDNPPAYQAYLDRYPSGKFRAIAQARIQGAALDAESQAQAGEAALALSRTDRREIQRNLSLLGYNPRGIDGIFGPGSRSAIGAWQRANGYEPNGYLTAQQIRSLAAAAKERADQLAAEAAARKAEEERRDTQYWRDTGRGATEAGLRSYLERYPDGLFADVAEARLADIEAQKRAQAEATERAFWDRIRARDTAADYQRYLDRYPRGLFVEQARARIKALTADDTDAVVAAAKEEEGRVVSNGVLRLLVENRLAAAGQDPGAVDGRFDKQTRRAVRRFQRDQGLTVTGFVTQATMVRLLAVP